MSDSEDFVNTFLQSGNADSVPRYDAYVSLPNAEYTSGWVDGFEIKHGALPRIEEPVVAAFSSLSIQIKVPLLRTGQLATPETVDQAAGQALVVGGTGGRPAAGVVYFTQRRVIWHVAQGVLLKKIPIGQGGKSGAIVLDVEHRFLSELALTTKRGKPDGNLILQWNNGGARSISMMQLDQTWDATTGRRGKLKTKELQSMFQPIVDSAWRSVEDQHHSGWYSDDGDICHKLPAGDSTVP